MYKTLQCFVQSRPVQCMKNTGARVDLDKESSKTINRTIWPCTWVFDHIIGRSSVISLLEPSPWAAHLVEDFWRPLGCHMCCSSFNDFTILSTVFVRHCGEKNRIYSLSQFSCCCPSVVSILRGLHCSIGDELFIIFVPQSWKQSAGWGEGRTAECIFFSKKFENCP